jgi:hypothetical protein
MNEHQYFATALIRTTVQEVKLWRKLEDYTRATRWIRAGHPTWEYVCMALDKDTDTLSSMLINRLWEMWKKFRKNETRKHTVQKCI